MEFGPHVAGQLRAAIRGDVIRHFKAGNPVTNEGSYAGVSSGIWQRNGFRPPGKAVHDREEVFHTLKLIERAH